MDPQKRGGLNNGLFRVTEGMGGETLLLSNKFVPMLLDQGRIINIQQRKFRISAVKLASHRANI